MRRISQFPPERKLRTPALDAWRAELAAGKRTISTFDWLWRAACLEMSALEEREPIRETYLRKARDFVRAAAKGKAA